MLVARSERLANLAYLSFEGMHAGDEGIAALAEATHFTKLRRLNLCACEMTSATLPALSRAAFAPQLEALAVGYWLNQIARHYVMFGKREQRPLWRRRNVDEVLEELRLQRALGDGLHRSIVTMGMAMVKFNQDRCP